MQGELDQLRATLSGTIIPALVGRLPDAAYGVTHFDDYPCGGYGASGDVPFQLHQRVTTDIAAAQRAVNGLSLHNGADGAEAGLSSLYQIATGAGGSACYPIAAFDSALNRIDGVADGTIGGVGFRDGSVPIVVQITDAPTHTADEAGYFGPTWTDGFSAFQQVGMKVVGVASGSAPRADLERIARETGAVVPACAWDAARPAGCGAGQCCTGSNGTGRGAAADGCPLVFDVGGDGTGLSTSIITGIASVIDFGSYNISTRLRPDASELASSGVDTTCFISAIRPQDFVGTGGSCTSTPEFADFDGDGELDGFSHVTPGTQVIFDIEAMNDCVPPTAVPQTFILYIDVVGGGAAVLDSQIVTILVPPDPKLQ